MAENNAPQNQQDALRPDDELAVDELENVAGGVDSNGSQCFCSNASCLSPDTKGDS